MTVSTVSAEVASTSSTLEMVFMEMCGLWDQLVDHSTAVTFTKPMTQFFRSEVGVQ